MAGGSAKREDSRGVAKEEEEELRRHELPKDAWER